jgi:hypothetical protein
MSTNIKGLLGLDWFCVAAVYSGPERCAMFIRVDEPKLSSHVDVQEDIHQCSLA